MLKLDFTCTFSFNTTKKELFSTTDICVAIIYAKMNCIDKEQAVFKHLLQDMEFHSIKDLK